MPDSWDWKKTVILLIPAVLLVAGVLVAVLLRRTLRTRVRMEKQLRADPDINEWLVVFGWSRKILYVPTILYSLVACGLMLLRQHGVLPNLNEAAVGGIWIALFVLNFLVDEYEISIKVLLIFVLSALALFLWLHFLGWVESFLSFFGNFGTTIGWQGYLVIALLFATAAAMSRGRSTARGSTRAISSNGCWGSGGSSSPSPTSAASPSCCLWDGSANGPPGSNPSAASSPSTATRRRGKDETIADCRLQIADCGLSRRRIRQSRHGAGRFFSPNPQSAIRNPKWQSRRL